SATELHAAAEGQAVDDVAVQLMGRIVVGDRTLFADVESIDDHTGESAAVFVGGTDVHRLREGVVHVELQTSGEALAQSDLQSVIGARTYRTPGGKGGELGIEHHERSLNSASHLADRAGRGELSGADVAVAGVIGVVQSIGGIADVAVAFDIDALSSV